MFRSRDGLAEQADLYFEPLLEGLFEAPLHGLDRQQRGGIVSVRPFQHLLFGHQEHDIGRRWLPPQPGKMLSLTSGRAMLAFSLAAIRKRQASASSVPPPMQWPFITPTVGIFKAAIRSNRSCPLRAAVIASPAVFKASSSSRLAPPINSHSLAKQITTVFTPDNYALYFFLFPPVGSGADHTSERFSAPIRNAQKSKQGSDRMGSPSSCKTRRSPPKSTPPKPTQPGRRCFPTSPPASPPAGYPPTAAGRIRAR